MILAFFPVLAAFTLEGWSIFAHKRAVFSGLSLTVKNYLIMGLAIVMALGLNSLAILLPIRAGIKRFGQETG